MLAVFFCMGIPASAERRFIQLLSAWRSRDYWPRSGLPDGERRHVAGCA
jgi:hypothetical protein